MCSGYISRGCVHTAIRRLVLVCQQLALIRDASRCEHNVVAVASYWMSVARLWATTCQAAEGYAANLRVAAGATHSHVCSGKLHVEIWLASLIDGTLDHQNWRRRTSVYCIEEASPLHMPTYKVLVQLKVQLKMPSERLAPSARLSLSLDLKPFMLPS
jgi:hypothetical protein